MIDEQLKAWIDSASPDEIIMKWAESPLEAPIMQGQIGEYFRDVVRIELAKIIKKKSPSVATRIQD